MTEHAFMKEIEITVLRIREKAYASPFSFAKAYIVWRSVYYFISKSKLT